MLNWNVMSVIWIRISIPNSPCTQMFALRPQNFLWFDSKAFLFLSDILLLKISFFEKFHQNILPEHPRLSLEITLTNFNSPSLCCCLKVVPPISKFSRLTNLCLFLLWMPSRVVLIQFEVWFHRVGLTNHSTVTAIKQTFRNGFVCCLWM